jgi:hypothetical protein
MKKLFVISLLLLATMLPLAAETDTSLLIGTWVNPEYDATRKVPKFVFTADGEIEEFATTYAKEPTTFFTYTVEEAWQDAECVHWYKIVAVKIQTQEDRFWYLLIRISPDQTTYEEDYLRGNLREFATEINPKSYFYKILYRE